MQLPRNMGSLDWSQWLLGLWAGAIQGGSNAVLSAIGVTVFFPTATAGGMGKFWAFVLSMFLWSAFQGMLAFLRQNPAPAVVVEKTVEKTTFQTAPVAAKIVETTTETSTHPADPPPPTK